MLVLEAVYTGGSSGCWGIQLGAALEKQGSQCRKRKKIIWTLYPMEGTGGITNPQRKMTPKPLSCNVFA